MYIIANMTTNVNIGTKSCYNRQAMIADINITEKSFGDKSLINGVKFSVDDGEKIGIVGRNGIGKSTLFGILNGRDTDFTGEIIFKRGVSVVSTEQEHHAASGLTVMQYILRGLPEYGELSTIIETHPLTMGDDIVKIEEYTTALERFDQKGFYQIEEKVERELETFQLVGVASRELSSLSGGQKRLVEIVKVMHSDAHLALLDEPTNHMDYIAKQQFIDWIKVAGEAMLIITHDRDVLQTVDRIIELKDGGSHSYKGNYDAYLKQNAMRTSSGMNDFEHIERQIQNLKEKVVTFRRLKERARKPETIRAFKMREQKAAAQLVELQTIEKPTFWIDKNSASELDYKSAGRYEKFKTRNIRMNVATEESRSAKVVAEAKQVALGYGDDILFDGVSFQLREKEAIEVRGRNGAGKTTLIKQLLSQSKPDSAIVLFDGELILDPTIAVGVYEQEVSQKYFEMSLKDAIEQMYLDMNLAIGETKVRQLMNNYLFTGADYDIPVARLSGGQKARLQVIKMLANSPKLLILDEPTNHLDLPSIEELETALMKYSGAILYVSHDGYFRDAIGGDVVQVGAQ